MSEEQKIPQVSRKEKIKMANDTFVGKTIKSIKEEKSLIVIENTDGEVLVFANPMAILLGLTELPKSE